MTILKKIVFALFMSFLLIVSGCSTSNDLNPRTGNAMAAVAGGAVGAGAMALAGGSKPMIFFAGLGGAGLGYYLSTLRFSSRGIVAAGGQVYTLGDYVIINLPTDNLFDPNTADFLPGTNAELQGVVNVLNRYPHHNIIISGNTSGSWTTRFELSMSLCRAEQVASFLWDHGIGTAIGTPNYSQTPKRTFVGYGDKFPIANWIRMKGIRQNSRIQIIAYPDQEKLCWGPGRKHFKPFNGKVEALDEVGQTMDLDRYNYAFSDDHTPKTQLADNNIQYNGRVSSEIPEIQSGDISEYGEFATETVTRS